MSSVHLTAALEFLLATNGARAAAPVLVAAARAAADSLGAGQAGVEPPAASGTSSQVRPTTPSAPGRPASRSAPMPPPGLPSWADSSGSATVAGWSSAATEWDALGWRHDAAYCRWRAAQVALAVGQGTVAGRLLRRAAADARQHAPLSAAIAATLRGG